MSRLGALNVLIIEFSFHEEHFIFRITASLSIFITFSASKSAGRHRETTRPFYFFPPPPSLFFPICKSSRVPSVANVLMPSAYRTVPEIPAPTIIASNLAFCGRPSSTCEIRQIFFYIYLCLFNSSTANTTSIQLFTNSFF